MERAVTVSSKNISHNITSKQRSSGQICCVCGMLVSKHIRLICWFHLVLPVDPRICQMLSYSTGILAKSRQNLSRILAESRQTSRRILAWSDRRKRPLFESVARVHVARKMTCRSIAQRAHSQRRRHDWRLLERGLRRWQVFTY